MGAKGPVPKRDAERRRRNIPAVPTESVDVTTIDVEQVVEIPEPDERWHPIAHEWYVSLTKSAQKVFLEPSDWATAKLVAESLSRDLKPQVVGLHPETGEPVTAVVPIKGANLSAYLKAFSELLVTEGSRRRVRVELERAKVEEALPDGVTDIRDGRKSRLA